MKVYLAGPIHECVDEDAKDWRDWVKSDALAKVVTFLDPMDRDYRGVEHLPGMSEQIVSGDKRDIDEADAVLAFCWKASYGTAMELMYAHERSKVIVVITDSGSPWLQYHADFVTDNCDSALQYLHAWAMTA